MTTPTPLTNTIWYGFFTTDLTATLPSSILSTPANLAYEVNNSSNNLGINTNIYFQLVSLNSDNVDTNLTINIDIADRPNVMTLTNLSSLPFNNNDGTNVYRNNVLINLTKYQENLVDFNEKDIISTKTYAIIGSSLSFIAFYLFISYFSSLSNWLVYIFPIIKYFKIIIKI